MREDHKSPLALDSLLIPGFFPLIKNSLNALSSVLAHLQHLIKWGEEESIAASFSHLDLTTEFALELYYSACSWHK